MKQLTESQIEQLRTRVGPLRIICGALIAGLLFPTAIFCAIADWQVITTEITLLTMFGLGFGLMSVVASLVVPKVIDSQAVGSPKDLQNLGSLTGLFGVYQTRTIIRYALLEGSAFFNVMMFFVERTLVPLGFVALVVGLMIAMLPRTGSVVDWIERTIEESR